MKLYLQGITAEGTAEECVAFCKAWLPGTLSIATSAPAVEAPAEAAPVAAEEAPAAVVEEAPAAVVEEAAAPAAVVEEAPAAPVVEEAPAPAAEPDAGRSIISAEEINHIADALEDRYPGAGVIYRAVAAAGERGVLTAEAMAFAALPPRASGGLLSAVRGLAREWGVDDSRIVRKDKDGKAVRLYMPYSAN